MDALAEVIHKLSHKLKILIITHNEEMKEKFDNIITVYKQQSGSTIRQ